ncbi:hypothetical protein dqs_0071 [Azoarcus olearius]|uniref:DUF2138 family protein n=1 Tax=Azoarcus sp. (strain BH72) TaxID=418699 RepID=UPI0008061950|nr:DUF2138 family protein [Azoarcus olearius]ANQ83154.1 hypothetical protein dqs_0071 [Azoarcus olearius]
MTSASRSPRRKLLFGVIVLALVVGAVALFWFKRFDGHVNALALDLARPDALIRTRSLARLPADLLRVPLARDVLTEDFVDYYERHEQRLALSGTLRRIAFEHRLSLPERVLESVFDEPAEVALWRGADGSLKHFAVAMTRNGLARALQMALPVLPDTQLESAGTLRGGKARLLVLQYGYGRQLLLAVEGDRVVALSDPGMLLVADDGDEHAGEEGAEPVQDARAAALVARLLESDAERDSPFGAHFALAPAGADEGHQLVVSSAFYTFGYGAFAPGVEALSFAFDDKGGWRTAALIDGARLPAGGLDGAGLWPALPHGPSLCALLPADWGALAPLAARIGAGAGGESARAGVGELARELFGGPAAVCWYGESRHYTPLFATTLRRDVDEAWAKELAALFDSAIGKGEPAQRAPVEAGQRGSARLWRRTVETPYGVRRGEDEPALAPTLAVSGRTLVFSPDAALVDKALDVGAKLYPAVGDSLPDGARTLALLEPAALAKLVRKEVFAALPRDEEAVLRNAADANLLPRLEALAKYPPLRLVRAEGALEGRGWHALQWESAGNRP